MLDFFLKMFASSGFVPHGQNHLWMPWLHANVIADSIIFGANFAISVALVVLLTKVKEIPFHFIYVIIGIFITACGIDHLLGVLTIRMPIHAASVGVKIVIAAASLSIAFLIAMNFKKICDLARGASLSRARDALKASEQLYKQIVDTANEGIWLIDLEDTTQFVNQRMADMLGYARDEMIGQPMKVFLDEAGHARVKASLDAFSHGGPETYEISMKRKDGANLWIRVSCSYLRGKDGEITGTLGMLTDITKKRLAEEKLRSSEVRFRSLMEALPQLVWSMDVDGTADYSNNNLVAHLGFHPTQVLPQFIQAIHPEEREKTRELWMEAFANGEAVECEYRLRRFDDSYRWQLGRILPLRDETGDVLKWMGIATDIHEQKEDQKVSRESQVKLKAALQNMNAFLWAIDKDYVVTTREGKYPEPVDEHHSITVGKSVFSLDDGYPQRNQALRDSLQGRSGSYEVQLGDHIRETFVNPLRDDSGEIVGAVAVSVDITERNRTEQRNREIQERLKILTEAVPQLIWTSNEKGRPTYFNNRWLQYTGLSLKASLNSELQTVLHPDDVERAFREWREAVDRAVCYQSELRLRNQAGEYRWHLARSLPVRDEHGDILQWFGTITDIHDQKTTEEKARALERNLMAILDFAPIILWAADREGRITLFQGKSLEKLNYKSGDLVGHSFINSTANSELKQLNHQRALAGESWTAIEQEAGLWFETHHSPMRNADGDIIGQVAVSTDITQRREAEIAQERHMSREASAHEASRLKSEFLAHMSHEIRTPLNGLLGMIQLISESPLQGEVRDFVEHAKLSGDALLSVIDNVLDFSKIEAGKLDVEIINLNLHDLIRDSEKSVYYQARSKGIRVYTEVSNKIPRFIAGDLGRLRQVLANLLTNALKFTAEGSVSLKVRKAVNKDASCGERATEEEAFLLFEVIDTGIGISEGGIQRIFDPFAQADSSTTRRFGGTGLGLSICKHLVEVMGGGIGVESKENKGSRFWFTIPFLAGVESDAGAPHREFTPISHELNAHILVADDNAINRKVILKFLDSMGLRAQAVSNGIDALKALNEDHYDLIFMDCQMPEMDGYECTRQIRQSAKPFSDIPIVALTASAMQRDYDRCLDVGMDSYIPKPIKREALYRAVVDHMPRFRNEL